ncbi:LemA family protein [Candidatus Uhrbacteria bacterium]|nr:LemA family protein [Candidatus Uhrbacteria bacterium]
MSWITLAVLATLVLIPLLTLWGCYNSLIALRNKARQALSGITVQLKRRADLIPNLVEVVKGYAKHERSVFERVTELRRTFLDTSVAALAKTDATTLQRMDKEMSEALSRLVAVAEAYPDLKASASYLKLQEQLAETEDQVAAARRIYNANVADYNTAAEQFPSVVVARMFSFASLAFFEDAVANQAPVPSVAGV